MEWKYFWLACKIFFFILSKFIIISHYFWQNCFEKDPVERMTCEQLLGLQYFNEFRKSPRARSVLNNPVMVNPFEIFSKIY